jgi:ABC-type glycerol-3-phosphate transport system substrate-binding protein
MAKMRTVRRLAAAALSVVLIAGCAPAPPEDEPIVLRAIFLPATWGVVVQEVLAPQYYEETGIRVEVELIGRDAIYERMVMLFAARDPSFDIFNIDYNWVPEFAEAGHLVPMDDVLTDEDRANFFEMALEVSSWEGVLYGLPQTIHPHLLWYRRDLFENPDIQAEFAAEYGRDLTPPATMEEWRDIVEFFHGREHNGVTLSGWAAQAARGFGNVHTWLTFLYSFGGDAFDWDTMRPTLSEPEAVAAAEFWADMMQFTPPGIHDFTYAEVTTAAQMGTIATALQWSWGAWEVDDPERSQTVGDWEFIQVPAGPGGSVPHLAAWTISVSRYSRHVEAAKDFVAWLQSKENDVVQADLGGGDPVRLSSYADPRLTEQTIPGTDILRFRRYPAVLEAMETTRPRPFFPHQERWEREVTIPLSRLQLGYVTAEEAMREADDLVERMMTELGYYN